LAQARADIESWRIDYNGVRPHWRLPTGHRKGSAQHIAVAVGASNGQSFNPGLNS